MCGINGIFTRKEGEKFDLRIQKMNEAISHRGPDANRYLEINSQIIFGHRRLSIIDTDSRADQPMISNNKRWTIVFNGEIYNFVELRKQVCYKFLTESDTEVILAYIERFGVDKFLKECNGMFSIALYDSFEKKLYLIRDRLGIKPLFYSFSNEMVVFSSEIKGILCSGLVDAEFNEDAIDEYLGNRYIRAPYTFFQNIYQLEPGHYVVIDEELNICKRKYWKLPIEFNYDSNYDEELVINDFEKELRDSITRRLVSDVNLGTYLSGGVDSSIITAITAMSKEEQIHTYTIGFKDLNEFKYSEMVAEKYMTEHHQIEIDSSQYFDIMEEIISYKDSPLGVPNEIPLAYMSRVLKENITVVLSGEGADELLGGYGRIYRSPYDFSNHLSDLEGDFYDYFIDKYEYVPRKIRDKYLKVNKPLRVEFDNKIRQEFKNRKNEENVFRFFHEFHVKGLLQRVDTTTMLASVEARVPFLDHKLLEYTYKNVPYSMKLKWHNEEVKKKAENLIAADYSESLDTPKYILKEIASNYLPSEVIKREKMGFPVPLNDWIELLEENANELLKDAYWLERNEMNAFFCETKNNDRAGQIIWMFINIEIFRKKYFTKNWKY